MRLGAAGKANDGRGERDDDRPLYAPPPPNTRSTALKVRSGA